MSISTRVTRHLEQLGLDYVLHVHARPLRSLEQAARERGLHPDQIVRSLVFRLEHGEFVLVLMPGRAKVSWGKLRHHLGVSRVTSARAEEVLQATGFEPGAVSPFALRQPVRLLADERIRELEVVSVGAGIPNAGVIVDRRALIEALQPELADLRDP